MRGHSTVSKPRRIAKVIYGEGTTISAREKITGQIVFAYQLHTISTDLTAPVLATHWFFLYGVSLSDYHGIPCTPFTDLRAEEHGKRG